MPEFNTSILLLELQRRQTTSFQSTCGFETGDPTKPRTANSGFDCRFDTLNKLWGFCPTTVIAATDCGLAGNCVDNHTCTSGCGIFGTPSITTFTCTGSGQDFCSTAFLTNTLDTVFAYIACGPDPGPGNLLATTTSPAPSSTSTPAAGASISLSKTASKTSAASTPLSSSLPSLSATASSSPSDSSPATLSASTSATNSDPAIPVTSSHSDNIGAIVGGMVGGLAVLAIFVLGIMFLRRYNKQPSNSPQRQRTNRRSLWNRYSITPMQTDGLHEKEAPLPINHEMEGSKYLPPLPDGNHAHKVGQVQDTIFELST